MSLLYSPLTDKAIKLFFSVCVCVCVCVHVHAHACTQSLNYVWLCDFICSQLGFPVHGIFRQEQCPCHFLLQGIFPIQGSNSSLVFLALVGEFFTTVPPLKVKVLDALSCPTLCNPVDCSPPVSSVHGILQARILEWGSHSFLYLCFTPNCP